jgi:hypothetical protein
MGRLSLDADKIGWPRAQERAAMEHYLGLDVSMEDIHIWEAEWDECCSGDKDPQLSRSHYCRAGDSARLREDRA